LALAGIGARRGNGDRGTKTTAGRSESSGGSRSSARTGATRAESEVPHV
jgi:hypothetical protein